MAIKVSAIYNDSPIRHLVRRGDSIIKIDGIDVTEENKNFLVRMKNAGEIRRLLIGRADSGREDNVICAGFGTKRDTVLELGICARNHIWWSNKVETERFAADIKRIEKDQKARKAQIEKISPRTRWTKMDYVPLIVTVGLIVVLMTIWSFFA